VRRYQRPGKGQQDIRCDVQPELAVMGGSGESTFLQRHVGNGNIGYQSYPN